MRGHHKTIKLINGSLKITILFSLLIWVIYFLLCLIIGTHYQIYQLSKIPKKSSVLAVSKEPDIQHIKPGLPTQLIIQKIGIDAKFQYVGLTKDGSMDVPTNAEEVGWYKLGSLPGENGASVIAGHVDGKSGSSGVFKDLNILIQGDLIEVIDENGVTYTFIVRESKVYEPDEDVPDVFNQDSGAHLNLITCDGPWNESKASYTKRLVIFSDILNKNEVGN